MAAGRYGASVMPICVILIVACGQAWSGVLCRDEEQSTKWLTKHLTDETQLPLKGRANRQLAESTTETTGRNGYRASLVDEDHKLHTLYNLSSAERIYRTAQTSRARARSLSSKVRAAPYYQGGAATRRRALQVTETDSSFESTVEATPGSYSMAFSIGTPPQNFIAIADTGSDLVWIQCAACTVCFNQSSALFQPGNSSTYKPLGCSTACSALGNNQLHCTPRCEYSYSYGDQSTTAGDYSEDSVTLENLNETTTTVIPDFKFGCGLQNNGTFTDTDGIVGLARGPISFPSQIAPYLNNVTIFSYCLADKSTNSSGTSPIIFGEAAVPTNHTGIVYTPIQSPYNVSMVPYYYVNLQGISVGGVNLSIPASAFQLDTDGNGGTIFDSGTTYTGLTSEAYTPVMDEFEKLLTDYTAVDLSQLVGFDLCYDVSGMTTLQVPRLTFHFENADFDLAFENIALLFRDSGSTYMCIALMEYQGMNIFGSTQQQSFLVIYDEEALRLGWKAYDCSGL